MAFMERVFLDIWTKLVGDSDIERYFGSCYTKSRPHYIYPTISQLKCGVVIAGRVW